MSDHVTREAFIHQIQQALEQAAQTKRTLTLIAGMIAIDEGRFEDWLSQFMEQMRSSKIETMESCTSKELIALVIAYQNQSAPTP